MEFAKTMLPDLKKAKNWDEYENIYTQFLLIDVMFRWALGIITRIMALK
jgi:hypothetical protein